MIFRLDPSILPYIASDEEDRRNRAISIIESLIQHRISGNNSLYIDRVDIIDCLLCSGLSDPAKNFLRYLKLNFSFQQSVFNLVDTYINISSAQLDTAVVDNKQVINFNLLDLDVDFFTKTKLLAENIIDASFYKKLAGYYATKLLNVNIYLDCSFEHGGGSTTAQVLEDIITNQSNACICIVDSDRKFPLSGIGDTARGLNRIYRKHKTKNPHVFLYILDVREAENLVPMRSYKKCLDKQLVSFVNLYLDLSDAACRYIDIKKGLSIKQFRNSLLNNDHIGFLVDTFGYHLDKCFESVVAGDYQCISSPGCSKCSNCTHRIIHGLGDKILEKAVDNFDSILEPCLIKDNLEESWSNLSKLLISWLIVDPPYSFS